MLLNQLIKDAPEIDIKQLSSDSRETMIDAIFFCISGFKYDGHDFVDEAIKNGAKVVVYEKTLTKKYPAIMIKVRNVDEVLKKIAKRFYNDPGLDIESFVVSGCHGRSSVSTFIYKYLNTLKPSGYIGRFGIKYFDYNLSTTYPTLPTLNNIRLVKKMKDVGIKAITFEANADNLSYNKLSIINPKVFIYTNTIKDSIDYKESENDYFLCLRHYLYSLEESTCIVLNRDDSAYNELKDVSNNVVCYGTKEDSDILISDIKLSGDETSFKLTYNGVTTKFKTRLLGLINVYNCVAAISALLVNGYDITDISVFFNTLNPIEGVMQKVDDKYHVIVDCADSLDSIKEVLEFGKFIKNNNRIIAIMGIGGNDDNQRIQNMMKLCDENLDLTILTEEDSYDADINKLLNYASSYLLKSKHILVSNRETAIETACDLMNSNDIVFIVGMGNEESMFNGLGKQPYSGDIKLAKHYIEKRSKEENEIIEVY